MNVLIVNNYAIGDPNPVGYTMQNMLLGMPGVSYLQYCVDYRPWAHTPIGECLFNEVTDSLAYIIKAGGLKVKQSTVKTEETKALPAAKNTNALGEFLRGVFYSMPCRVSKKNIQRIREFKPDVIYTMAENIRVINQAIKLSKKLNIPIVYHGMDDYKSTAYMANGLTRIFHRHLESRFKKMHEYTVENIGICEGMAEYYGKLYGKPYSYAGNCIFDFNDEPYEPDNSKPLKIIYSGSLHFHRGDMLKRLAAVVDELNGEGVPVELEIYAPQNSIDNYKTEEFKHTKWQPYAYPQTEKMRTFKAADMFVHTESADKNDMVFVRYSFSTKLPEYFAIGRPVIGFGPKELASISYISDHGCGMTADSETELKSVIKQLYLCPSERVRLGENAFETAKNAFSQRAMQQTIYNTMKRSTEAYHK